MNVLASESSAAWSADELNADQRWIFALDHRARRDLAAAVSKARDPGKTLLDYRREDFDLGSAWPVIDAALTARRSTGARRRRWG